MTRNDQGQLLEKLEALHELVLTQVKGMDLPAALQWMEDALDDAYSGNLRTSTLKIYLGEVRQKAPRSQSIAESIDAIEQLLDAPSVP